MKKLLLLLLLMSARAWSQSTTVSGQVLDPAGKRYCNASITANLINPSGKAVLWNGSPLTGSPTWTSNADSNANFSMQLPDLNFLGPGTGFYYSFTISSTISTGNLPSTIGQPNPPNFYVTPVTNITGTSVVLTAQIQAVSLPSVPGMCDTPGGGGGGGSGFKSVPNCIAGGTVLNETVQESSQVVNGVTQTCATVGATGSTSVIGICSNQGTCGNGGIAQVATSNTNLCPFDGAATQGDYVIPSPTVAGFCNDAGPIRPPSGIVETIGNVFQANTGGAGTNGTVQIAPLSILLPGSNGGSGTVTACASGAGANAYYPGIGTVISCDPLVVDLGGGMGMNFLQLRDSGHAGFYNQTQGPQPPPAPLNSIQEYPPTSVPTPYSEVRPGASGTVGQTRVITSTGTDANGNPILNEGWGTAGGTTVTLQTNTVNNASQALLNFKNTTTINASNPSGGIEQFSLAGSGQLGTPTTPTVTPQGTTGATTYSYMVIGVQDGVLTSGATHYTASAVGTTSTGNATLSSSNNNLLSGYGDNFYGVRGFIICRTVGGASQGILTGTLASPTLAGKTFTDTGLAADGTNCATAFATNTTKTDDHCFGSALPGTPTTPGFPCGVDGPPLLTNARDAENGETFDAPAGANSPFWVWLNQHSATAVWSSGAIKLTSDTAADITLEGLAEATALPSTPYEFEVYVTMPSWRLDAGCGLGLRESSTGKMTTFGFDGQQQFGTTTGQGGVLTGIINWSSFTGASLAHYIAYSPTAAAYIKIKNDGTTLTYNFSLDGVSFDQSFTQTVVTPFTTAPNQVFVFTSANATSNNVCSIDFLRRTQ